MNVPLVLLNRRRQGGAFSPTRLFALAEPGVWYDPSDLTTLFQDPAGTTPVTTPGQTVALALDKSKGLVLGPELAGGILDSTSGWTFTGNVTVASGVLAFTTAPNATANAVYNPILSSGRRYQITFTASGTGLLSIRAGSGGDTLPNIAAPGTFTITLQAGGGTPTQLIFSSAVSSVNNYVGNVSNISVRELPGFHATQSILASRPTYGIVPRTGRRNLLTFTNDLTNLTNWPTGSIAGMTRSGAGISVDGANNYGYISRTANSVSFVSGVTYVWSVVVTSNQTISNVPLRLAFASSGPFTPVSTLANLQAGVPLRVSFVIVATSTGNGTPEFGVDTRDAIVPGGSNATGYVVTFSDPQLEVGSIATAYQRVTTQFDVTEAGVPSLHYLFFDGIDDFLVTPTITPGIDKAQVFAGVRKLSDVARGVVVEHSASVGANSGAFVLSAPDGASASYGVYVAGTVLNGRRYETFTAPITNVLAASLASVAADSASSQLVRINTIPQAGTSVNTGNSTGNFLAYPLYIGRRGGTSLPFNGQLYSLIVRFGANLDANTITNTEIWVNSKTGAY